MISEKLKKLFNKTFFSLAEVDVLFSLSYLITKTYFVLTNIDIRLFKPAKSLLTNRAFAKLIP